MKDIIGFIAKYWHPKNIVQELLSTFIGLLLGIVSLYSFFENQITAIELSGLMTLCAFFMGINLNNLYNKGGTAGAALVLMVSLYACQKPLLQSQITSDSTWTKIKKDTLFVKSESVQKGINYDSLKTVLLAMLKQGLKPEIVYRNSPNSPTSLTFKLDNKGGLLADCTKGDQLIEYLTIENNRLRKSYQVKVIKELPDIYKYIIGGLAAISAYTSVLLFIKKS